MNVLTGSNLGDYFQKKKKIEFDWLLTLETLFSVIMTYLMGN